MKNRQKIYSSLPLIAAGAVLALVAVAYIVVALRGPGSEQAIDTASIGGPFALTDQTGKPRTEADFRGRAMLIFFGYSYCPDVCSLALANMTAAVDALGSRADEVVPIFITIDPDRDTVARLANYAANFGPKLVALTGNKDAIAAVAKAYHVYYAKTDVKSATDYLMDHSSTIYLMGPDGRYLTHFRHTATANQMSFEILKRL